MSFKMRKIVAGVAAVGLATLGGLAQSAPAQAQTTACGSGFCTDYSVIGDLDYTEVMVTGTFTGKASMALDALRLCDEKSDTEYATATFTIALRHDRTGATSYTTYRNQEFFKGPAAGCTSIGLQDYVAPPGYDTWAVRADYDYKAFGGKAEATSHPQTYHTAWVYNAYLYGWCPTCKATGK
jgi:hypothetical protein